MYPKVSRTVGWFWRTPMFVLVGSLAAFTFSPVSLRAAEARSTGAVTGRVLHAATGQYLNNARVAIAGTDLVTFTDQAGTYHLVGWQLTTQYHGGSAAISGVEFNVRHGLGFAGAWGRYFEVFANGTKLDLDADNQAGFANTISGSANWGFTFSRKSLTLMTKWNYRGLTRGTRIPAVGAADGYQWDKERTTLDANLDYRLTARLALFANARNALGANPEAYRYGAETPEYARQFRIQKHGGQFMAGVKGTF